MRLLEIVLPDTQVFLSVLNRRKNIIMWAYFTNLLYGLIDRLMCVVVENAPIFIRMNFLWFTLMFGRSLRKHTRQTELSQTGSSYKYGSSAIGTPRNKARYKIGAKEHVSYGILRIDDRVHKD